MSASEPFSNQAPIEPAKSTGGPDAAPPAAGEPQPRVSEEQREAFRRDGFLVVEGLSTPEEIEWMRVVYDRLFGERRGWDDGALFDMVRPDDLERGLALPQMLSPSRYAPVLRETRLCASAYGIARQLLGPKIENNLEHAILKPPQGGAATPWHQDEAFWRPGWSFEESISVWMPLQDVDVESGCMQYIRGSNRGPLFAHRSPGDDPRIHGLEIVSEPDLSQCVAAPIRAGSAVIHHSRTVHGAGANHTDEPRRAYVLGFGVQTRSNRLFTRDYPWNCEKVTAREARELRSLPAVKRLSRKILSRLRGHS